MIFNKIELKFMIFIQYFFSTCGRLFRVDKRQIIAFYEHKVWMGTKGQVKTLRIVCGIHSVEF